jgi:hypothetical protein
MRKTLYSVVAVALTGGGLAVGYARDMKPLPPVTAIGAPVSCVSTYNIRSTRVIDDQTIDFEMSGRKLYRNTLPYSCPSLKSEERFSYKPTGSQLCSVDTIRVLNSYGGHLQEGAGCGLGKFQQIEKVKGR